MIFDITMILVNMVMMIFNVSKGNCWLIGLNVVAIILFTVHIVLVKYVK